MKQMIFETRQKSEELLQQALAIWRQSDQVDYLEDIEKDPVFSLLMMALAYQSNELDSEVERLKTEVVEEFSRMLIPFEMGHAMPATVLVQTALKDDLAEYPLNENCVFQLSGEHPFIPLLETRVLNAEVRPVVRLDGRRWKVTLSFRQPVKDLSHFAFVIRGVNYRDLSVTLKGQRVPLIKPWQYSELPFTHCFAAENITYNMGMSYLPSSLPMDLFVRQNVRLFCIEPGFQLPTEMDSLDLVFEFSGISDGFAFDKAALSLNPVLLVNARLNETTLTSDTPVARLVGSQEAGDSKNLTGRSFLHLIRPAENQLFGQTELQVRGVAGDRFNMGSLMRLVNCIITKFHSDFYAFQQFKGTDAEDVIARLEAALARLKDQSAEESFRNVSGVYLIPRRLQQVKKNDFSLGVTYLTTAGAAINPFLVQSSTFTAPSGFNSAETQMIAVPVPGMDEIRDDAALGAMMRYYVLTSDRIVTMADIRAFCYKQLLVQFGIGNDIIRQVSVHRRRQRDSSYCGYEILAEITLSATSFVKRSLQDKLPQTELLLQKMIEVRSANIYPVTVSIILVEEEQK